MQQRASEIGADGMVLDEINGEIVLARRVRDG